MGDFIFRCTKNHPLVFSNSKIMCTWHICYTSNSNALKIRRPTPQYYRNKSPRSHGIIVNLVPVVLPWSWSPSPWCYRELCPHYRGVTAGKPWSSSPCSSLAPSRGGNPDQSNNGTLGPHKFAPNKNRPMICLSVLHNTPCSQYTDSRRRLSKLN